LLELGALAVSLWLIDNESASLVYPGGAGEELEFLAEATRLMVSALDPSDVRSSPGTCPPETQSAATGTTCRRCRTGSCSVGAGDAAGHGLAAATSMAELRNAARGIGFAGHSPAQLLAGLSALVAQNGLDSFATAAYGRIDPTTGSGSWVSAGHLPFLLLPVDGPPRYLDVPGSPPLGVGGTATDHRIDLRPSDTLLLFTDGLVERRASPSIGAWSGRSRPLRRR
jgi:hypothetical protein